MEAVVTGRRIAAAILCGALTLTACATATPLTRPSWLAPPDPMALAEQAGVETTEVEHLTTHTHAHLEIAIIIGTPPDRIPDSFPFGDNP